MMMMMMMMMMIVIVVVINTCLPVFLGQSQVVHLHLGNLALEVLSHFNVALCGQLKA